MQENFSSKYFKADESEYNIYNTTLSRTLNFLGSEKVDIIHSQSMSQERQTPATLGEKPEDVCFVN